MQVTELSAAIMGKDYKTMQSAGFHSRALNPAETNYQTHDKEMLALLIVWRNGNLNSQALDSRFLLIMHL